MELKDEALPVETLAEALPHLRRPFTAAAVKWKVQSVWKNGRGGVVVAYIDARLVMERLDAVCGENWFPRYEPAGQGLMWCHLTLFGTTRPDMGAGQGQGSMAAKANVSDALKRAAVTFGVGRSIYAMAQATMDARPEPIGNQLRSWEKTSRDGKKSWSAEITPGAADWLREKYAQWLKAKGEALFGPALDHGDEIGAQGADDEAPVEELAAVPEEASPALGDERALALLAEIESAYGEVRKMNGAAYPPAKFRKEKEAASGSHEALEALLADLTRIRDEMKAARA